MAQLLGSKHCIESLSKDVYNLQDTIETILEKTGKLEYSSWKFPTENSSLLDVKDLLDDYSYCNDEDANKFAHIILFELVIDRFCLLLQSVTKLYDISMLNNESNEERPESRTVTSTMSVGLISKMFWNKVSQIQYTYHKTEKEVSFQNQNLMKLENEFLEIKLENENLKLKRTDKTSNKKGTLEQTVNNTIQNKNDLLPVSTKDGSTQTYETAFLPCEFCNDMQSNLMNVGNDIIKICEAQGLPSVLSKQKRLMKDVNMSTKDIRKWSEEEMKDLIRIKNHISAMANEITPLKISVTGYEKECNELKNEIKEIQNANDKISYTLSELKQSEIEYINEQEKIKQLLSARDETISKMKIDEENYKNENKLNETELVKQKAETQSLEENILSLSKQLKLAQEEALTFETYKDELQRSNSIKDALQTHIDQIEEELKRYKVDLDKSKAENRVLLRHDESLQKKQANLLSRLEQMEEDSEELNEEINVLKEENENLVDKTKELSQESETLKDQLSKVNNNNYSSNHDNLIYQIKLLVNYPVFSQHYKKAEQDYQNILDNPEYEFNESESNENVVDDMENQLQANRIRLSVLKEENEMLKSNLIKLQGSSIEDSRNQIINGTHDKLIERDHLQHLKQPRHHSAPIHSDTTHNALVPRPPSEPRLNKTPNRLHSRNTDTFDITSRLANLERMKNSTKIDSSINMVKPAWADDDSITSQRTHDIEEGAVVCPDCNKTYLSNKDLDIHRTFCYGRI